MLTSVIFIGCLLLPDLGPFELCSFSWSDCSRARGQDSPREQSAGAGLTSCPEPSLSEGEEGFWVAECPSLPGCISQGDTRAKAIANIREAIEGYIAVLEEDGLNWSG